MENHPIPQDVTGFKFRLIGSVTVKQFLYILGAGALCGVFFIMPVSFLIKWPAILFIASLGAGLAFLPIEGRPMDVMLINFLKALPAENRYIFHKKGAEALLHDFFTLLPALKPAVNNAEQKDNRRELLLNQLVRKSTPYKADENELKQMQDIKGMFDASDTSETTDTVTPLSGPSPIQADSVAPQEPTPKIEEQPTPPAAEEAVVSPVASVPLPSPEKAPPSENASVVVSVAPEDHVQTGFPQIPDTPNVVLGIVKDARGKVLPNIIVEVVDSTGNPVRAFKTNALGQFASATPLPVGQYKIILEDTRHIHEFSPIDIEMNNEIFQPLEIISTDQREKLRQELFGNAQGA